MTKYTFKDKIELKYTLIAERDFGKELFSCHIPEFGIYFSAKTERAAIKKGRVMAKIHAEYLINKNKTLQND